MNWDLEREIWGRALKAVLGLQTTGGGRGGGLAPANCAIIMTEPLFNFPQIQAATEQVRLGGRGG